MENLLSLLDRNLGDAGSFVSGGEKRKIDTIVIVISHDHNAVKYFDNIIDL
ncbi:MAG: hypothetical protein RR869_03930 [Lachnospiraceae bacterium]